MPSNTTTKKNPVHYYLPTRLRFEHGCIDKIGEHSRDIANRVIILSVQDELMDPEKPALIKESFDEHANGALIYDTFEGSPSYDELDSLVYFIRQSKADTLVAYGGRESMYAAKAASFLSANEIFAEDIGSVPFETAKPPLSCITVPAAPIMGEELASHLYLYNPDAERFFYAKSSQLFPKASFVDPVAFLNLPHQELVSLYLAIIAASVESVISRNADDISVFHSMHAIDLAAHSLNSFLKNELEQKVLENLSLASVFSGMAYSHSGLGLSYSLAVVMNRLLGINFYEGINLILPHVMEFNLTLVADSYIHIAKSLGEDIKELTVIEAAIKAVEMVRKLGKELGIPNRLSKLNIDETQLEKTAEHVFTLEAALNNPRDLELEDINKILQSAL